MELDEDRFTERPVTLPGCACGVACAVAGQLRSPGARRAPRRRGRRGRIRKGSGFRPATSDLIYVNSEYSLAERYRVVRLERLRQQRAQQIETYYEARVMV